MAESNEPTDPKGTEPDRRRGERVAVNNEFGRMADEAATWVSDLSEGGVFVHSRDQLPVGSLIELRFTVFVGGQPRAYKGLFDGRQLNGTIAGTSGPIGDFRLELVE